MDYNLLNKMCLLLIAFVLISCDYSYKGKERWKGRRASSSIKESKERGVFDSELQFKSSNPLFNNKIYFIKEKGFRWGDESSEQTRIIGDSVCQIVGFYVQDRDDKSVFGDTLIAKNDFYALNGFYPVACDFTDSIQFFLIINADMYRIDTIAEIKLWNQAVN